MEAQMAGSYLLGICPVAALQTMDCYMGSHLSAQSLQCCATGSFLSLGFKPTGSFHELTVPTVTTQHCSMPAQGVHHTNRRTHGAQNSANLGAEQWMEEREGGGMNWCMKAQDWSEHKSQNTIFHAKIILKRAGRDFKWTSSLSIKAESAILVTVQRYVHPAWH